MRKKYKNPPLIEALCEFYFAPEDSQDFENTIHLLNEKIQTHFPKKFRLQLQASQINVDSSGIPIVTEQLLPLVRFQSSTEKVLIQLSQNLLTINHLKPYTSWEEFLPSVEIGYNAYREVVKPKAIHRIALRYINRIEITRDRIGLEDYFELRPFIGQKLLQDISAFNLGIQIQHEKARDALNIQMASIDSGSPKIVAIMLDLTYSLVRLEDITFDSINEWLIVAKELASQTTASSKTQSKINVMLLNAIHRAYYGAFRKARNHLRDKDGHTPFVLERRNTHQTVIELFYKSSDIDRQLIGQFLLDLRSARNKADYDDTVPNLPGLTMTVLLQSEQVIDLLKTL